MTFERFRPASHFIAPHSWSNDPCGACFIPETKEYIVCYQWNPGTSEGGNCAWGMAKSKDLVTWEDCSPALRNGDSYDSLGVFSGSIVSRLVEGKRVLFLFYTSVSALPIHWSKPYLPGCESQSVAYSTDYGRSWQRWQNNPLLSAPPNGDATTGWRDPFVSQWTSLSEMLGVNEETNYMLIASGVKEHGSKLHLYCSQDLCDGWEYLSTILDVKSGAQVSSCSDYFFGVNFECASFFSLGNTSYIVVCVEEDEGSTRHSRRFMLWLSGTMVVQQGKPKFTIENHGVLDHGILYAPHMFRDDRNRVLQLGWADEAATPRVVRDQGWAGCLAHPRELFQITRPLNHEVAKNNPEWNAIEETLSMTTLGVRPAPQLDAIRGAAGSLSLTRFTELRSTTYEFSATFPKLSGTEKFVFNVRQSPDSAEVTRLIFNIADGSITVDRSRSSSSNLGTSTPDIGRLRLLPGEDLQIRVFVDVSIVEIYANDRFALTSRIYPSLESSRGASYDLGHYSEESVRFACWDKLADAWPARKAGHIALQDPQHAKSVKRRTEDKGMREMIQPIPSTVRLVSMA